MSDDIRNAIAREAQRVGSWGDGTRYGIVSSYDPENYAIKVMRQPEGVESGWMPIKTMWGGPGWGMFAPPVVGGQIKLEHQEDGTETPVADGVLFSDEDPPRVQDVGTVPSGEFWLVHRTGTRMRFLNDNTFEINHAMMGRMRFLPDSTIETIHVSGSRVRLLEDTSIEVVHRDNGYLRLAGDGGVHLYHKGGSHLSILPDTTMELVHQTGSLLRLMPNGNILLQNASGGMRLTMDQSGTVNLRGAQVLVGGEGNVLRLVTEAFQAVFNAHVHPSGNGVTGPPTPALEGGHLTAGLKAN